MYVLDPVISLPPSPNENQFFDANAVGTVQEHCLQFETWRLRRAVLLFGVFDIFSQQRPL